MTLVGGAKTGGLSFLPGGAASSASFCGAFRQLGVADTVVATVDTLRTLPLLNLVNADEAVVPPERELVELEVRQLLELAPMVD